MREGGPGSTVGGRRRAAAETASAALGRRRPRVEPGGARWIGKGSM